jgi:hypothetical protein
MLQQYLPHLSAHSCIYMCKTIVGRAWFLDLTFYLDFRYCVAWYPIYRIPDGKFQAAFLTYHSLGHLVRCKSSLNQAGHSLAVLPVMGLQSYNDKVKCWYVADGIYMRVCATALYILLRLSYCRGSGGFRQVDPVGPKTPPSRQTPTWIHWLRFW